MSVRTEYFAAGYSSLRVRNGQQFNAEVDPVDPLDRNDVTVTLGADEAAVLYGSRDRIRQMLTQALSDLDALPEPLTVDERLDLIEKSGWPIAFDGCHKLYFLQDEYREAEARELEYQIHPSGKVRELYEGSCFLRFVSRWGHDNGDFDHEWNIDQGEVD